MPSLLILALACIALALFIYAYSFRRYKGQAGSPLMQHHRRALILEERMFAVALCAVGVCLIILTP